MRSHGFFQGSDVSCRDLYNCFGLVALVLHGTNPYYCPFCVVSRHDPVISTTTLDNAHFSFTGESDWLNPVRFVGSVGDLPTISLQNQIPSLASIRDVSYLFCQDRGSNWYLRALFNTEAQAGGTLLQPEPAYLENMTIGGAAITYDGEIPLPSNRRLPPVPGADFLPCHCNRCG